MWFPMSRRHDCGNIDLSLPYRLHVIPPTISCMYHTLARLHPLNTSGNHFTALSDNCLCSGPVSYVFSLGWRPSSFVPGSEADRGLWVIYLHDTISSHNRLSIGIRAQHELPERIYPYSHASLMHNRLLPSSMASVGLEISEIINFLLSLCDFYSMFVI